MKNKGILISVIILIFGIILASVIISVAILSSRNKQPQNNEEQKTMYTVMFDSCGGNDVDTQQVAEGECLKAPATPIKDKDKFLGWYLDKQYTNKYNFTTPVTDYLMLYAKWAKNIVDSCTFTLNDDAQSYTITSFNDTENNDTIFVPKWYQALQVTAIGKDVFKNCTQLKDVTLPESIKIINDNAFQGCSNLTRINLLSSITSIGKYAFDGCSSLTGIKISENVTRLGDCVFQNCTSLTAVTMSDNVTQLGYNAFYGCTSLKTIKLSNNITDIGSRTFYNCTALETINVPTNVTRIGLRAFGNCQKLTSLVIPASVTYVGDSAFTGCVSSTVINFVADSATGWHKFWNDGCDATIVWGYQG